MSAFMVSDEHINVILTFAKVTRAYCPTLGSMPDSYAYCENDRHLTALGKALYAANVASLNARYPANAANDMGDNFKFVHDKNVDKAMVQDKKRLAANMAGILDCFDYQACEVKDYKATLAADIIRRIRGEVLDIFTEGFTIKNWSYDGEFK